MVLTLSLRSDCVSTKTMVLSVCAHCKNSSANYSLSLTATIY